MSSRVEYYPKIIYINALIINALIY